MRTTTKELAEKLRVVLRDYNPHDWKGDVVEQAADRLKELDAEGWRSVEGGMPPPNHWYMVCDATSYVRDAVLIGDEWQDEQGDNIRGVVTHWRTWPAPPTPGQSGGGE